MFHIGVRSNLVSTLALGAFLTVSAFASPILVGNASFETLPGGGLPFTCGVGCSYDGAGSPIPNWTTTGTDGQFQPGTNAGNFTFFSTLSDGITSAYSNGGTISQTVIPTVALGITYILQVDLGRRNDLASTGSAGLLVNGNLIGAVGVAPTAGNWSTFTASYTGLAADVGKAITIQLASSGIEGNFDNVRLADSITTGAVPEPATATVFALGLAALFASSRRKRTV